MGGIVFVLLAVIFIFVMSRRKSEKAVDTTHHEPTKSAESRCRSSAATWIGTPLVTHAPPPNELMGYANLPLYIVSGRKSTTNRMNTKCYAVPSEDAARQCAYIDNLVDPLTVEIRNEKYQEDKEVPPGSSYFDVDQLENSMSFNDIDPMDGGFWDYATRMGIRVSRFTGKTSAAYKVWHALDDAQKAALYCYAVYCAELGIPLGNMLTAKDPDIFQRFSAAVSQNKSAMQSILGRDGKDLLNPNRNTVAYRTAVKFLL